MTSASSVKVERDVVKDEKEGDTSPFDSTNLDDPLGDKITVPKSEMKAKEAFGDEDEDANDEGRSHSNSSGNVKKRLKVFIIPDGRQLKWKYATPEESRKAKTEWQRQRRANMKKEANLERTNPVPSRYEKCLKARREYYKKRMERIRNDPEKYEESKKKNREYAKRKRERLRTQNPEKYEEGKRKMREWHKKRKEQNPEKCAERKDREYNANARKKNPKQETEEEREKRKRKNRLHYRKNRERLLFAHYSRTQMQKAQMTDEELAAFKAKRNEYAKKWRESLTGEKLEKYRTYFRNRMKKYYYERRLKGIKEIANKDKVKARYRKFVANETPERRQRRLRRCRISEAVKTLKKQLEKIEASPEEVERRVTELRRTMEAEPLPPLETLPEYKPKPRVKSDVDFSIPPRSRSYGGRRGGRPPSSSQIVSNSQSNSEASCDSESQTGAGVGSTEMNNSDDFEDHGFQCDNNDPVPVLQFDIKCPHCPSTYSERSDLISHISSEHSEICWKCPKCKLIVLSTNDLREHMNTSHSQIPLGSTHATASKETSAKKERTFTCMKCDPTKSPHFECVKDLMTHVESTHPHSYWPCLKCNILKYTKCALKVHEKLCKFAGRTIKPSGRERELMKK